MDRQHGLHRELSDFLNAYFAAWNTYDVPVMTALWDEGEEQPIYLAEECEPHIGWPAILRYWGVDRSAAERLYPKPFGGPVRISMVLRRKPEGWRAIHYVEAPLASLIQLRRAHEDAVDPALHARLAAKGVTYQEPR